jgi:N-acetylmuramoyl-L-alanine amidase
MSRSILGKRRALHALIVASAALGSIVLPPPAFAARKAPLVVVDAGHGGRFPGAVNCAFSFAGKDCMLEADVNLAIARQANAVIRRWGFRTRMTRRRHTTVNRPLHDIATWNARAAGGYRFYRDGVVDVHDDLQARVNVANCARRHRSCTPGSRKQAHAFVSIHNNACGRCGAGGTITFYWRADAARLASLIQREVVKRAKRVTRGTRTALFYVVHWTRMPSVLLEATFLDNNREARLLRRQSFRAKIARGIAAGTSRFLCNVVGGPGRDVLSGTPGRDVICGLRGNDRIQASAGRDVVLGGPGTDTISYENAPRAVSVNLGERAATGAGRHRLVGIENVIGSTFADTLTGSYRSNVLTGLDGADTLLGRAGDDRLVGGNGDDTLNGGLGEDRCEQGPGQGAVEACEGT